MEESKSTGRGKALPPEVKQEIIAGKGKVKAEELAKKLNVGISTVYNTWARVGKKNRAKKKASPATSGNPNQKRIDFCKKWIAILTDEVKRLEKEPDVLKEAEAALSKVISTR